MKNTTLVLGASMNPSRYSNLAIKRLRQYDQEVIAVGLREGKVDSVPIVTFEAAFAKADTLKEKVDSVTLYLNPKRQEAYYDLIIKLAPRRVIFNPGTENQALYALLEAEGIQSEIACTLVLLGTNQY